jgi:prolyl oligopeptidase
MSERTILYIEDRGKGKKGNAIFVRDASKNGKQWEPLVPEVTDDEFDIITNVGGEFLVRTNKDAPNWKVVAVDSKNPEGKN